MSLSSLSSHCRFLTALVKEIFFRLFCCNFFSVFISSMPSMMIINSNKIYVLMHKYILAWPFSELILMTARAKINESETGPKHI